MAWLDQGMDNDVGLRIWFNTDTGETKYGQYGSSLPPDAFDANGTMISTGWNPNMAVPDAGFTVGQAVSPNYLNSGVDLSSPTALAAAVQDVAPKYTGPLDMNAVIPPDQMRAPAKDNGFENLLGMGAMAGLGYLSGGFGLGDLWSSLSNTFNPPSFSGTFDPSLPTGPIAGGAAPTQVGGWEWSADPRFTGTTVDGVLQNSGNPNWWQTDWGTEGLVDLGTTTGGVSASSLGGTAASAAASALGGTGGSSGGGSLSGALGNAAGAGSVLSRILDGTATSADWLSLGGTGLSTALGFLGSQQQTNAFKDLANKYSEYGAPSRARYEAAMSPGFDITSIPGYQGALDSTSESLLRKLSATGGNPYGNPGGLIEANKAIVNGTAMPAYNEYARLNANTGFGSSMNAAIPFQTAAINSDANSLNAIGSGLASLTTPKNSLQDLLKQMQGLNQGMSLV